MRYRILIIFLFSVLITPTGLYARNQKMNSLRAGIGINVHDHYYGLSAGPSQFIEYNREINGYFSAGLSLHTDQARLRYTTDDHCKPKVHGFTFCIFEMARLDRNRCRFDI